MVGRLRGIAFQFALALQAPRCHGPTSLVLPVTGVDLLAEPEIPSFTTSDDGTVVPLQKSGPQHLLTALKNEYGAKTQDMILAVLDN